MKILMIGGGLRKEHNPQTNQQETGGCDALPSSDFHREKRIDNKMKIEFQGSQQQ